MALWATPDGPAFGCGSFFARPLRKPVPCRSSFKDSRAARDRKVSARTSFRSRSTWTESVLDECIVAYAMNGEPLPMLNGFPVRLVVPGYFATYWMKCLTWIRVLDKTDDNFWMKSAYRIPDTPRGNTTPEDVKAGTVKMIPISRMPVRSFLVSPDGDIENSRGDARSGARHRLQRSWWCDEG